MVFRGRDEWEFELQPVWSSLKAGLQLDLMC